MRAGKRRKKWIISVLLVLVIGEYSVSTLAKICSILRFIFLIRFPPWTMYEVFAIQNPCFKVIARTVMDLIPYYIVHDSSCFLNSKGVSNIPC